VTAATARRVATAPPDVAADAPAWPTAPARPLRGAFHARSLREHVGSTRIALGLARELTGLGHAIDVYAERLVPARVRAAGGRPRWPLPFWLPRLVARHLYPAAARSRHASRVIAGRNYDLVISGGDLLEQDVFLLHNMIRREVEALRAFDDPRYRTTLEWQEHCLTRHRFRLLVANSRLMRGDVCARYGLDPDAVAVVHPAVDTVEFSRHDHDGLRAATRAELGVAAGAPLVGFITSGNFALRGVEALVEVAAALVAEGRPDLRVLAIGSERNAAGLAARFAARGLQQVLVTRGKSSAVARYFHAIDLLLHPARVEAYGLVVHEAAACGCPVVTSDAVGAAELFTGPGRTAVTARPDVAELLPLTQGLLTNPALRAAVAESQWRAASARGWDAYTRDLLAAVAVIA
jgi:UDP-glucose:(heptosyl)LPS alpha-1,3-glucosyltransferase